MVNRGKEKGFDFDTCIGDDLIKNDWLYHMCYSGGIIDNS